MQEVETSKSGGLLHLKTNTMKATLNTRKFAMRLRVTHRVLPSRQNPASLTCLFQEVDKWVGVGAEHIHEAHDNYLF